MHADVTSVLQEFVAGLPAEAAALGQYLTHQQGVASGLVNEAAADAAAAVRTMTASLALLGAAAGEAMTSEAAAVGAGVEAAGAGIQAGLAALAQGPSTYPLCCPVLPREIVQRKKLLVEGC